MAIYATFNLFTVISHSFIGNIPVLLANYPNTSKPFAMLTPSPECQGRKHITTISKVFGMTCDLPLLRLTHYQHITKVVIIVYQLIPKIVFVTFFHTESINKIKTTKHHAFWLTNHCHSFIWFTMESEKVHLVFTTYRYIFTQNMIMKKGQNAFFPQCLQLFDNCSIILEIFKYFCLRHSKIGLL